MTDIRTITFAKDNELFHVPEVLPVLPLRDVVVFPYMVIPLMVGRPSSVAGIEAAMLNERLVVAAEPIDWGHDRTLLRENLTFTPEQRIEIAPASGWIRRLPDAAAVQHERLLESLVHRAQRIERGGQARARNRRYVRRGGFRGLACGR